MTPGELFWFILVLISFIFFVLWISFKVAKKHKNLQNIFGWLTLVFTSIFIALVVLEIFTKEFGSPMSLFAEKSMGI